MFLVFGMFMNNKMKFNDNIKDLNRYSNVLTITFNNNETKSFYI